MTATRQWDIKVSIIDVLKTEITAPMPHDEIQSKRGPDGKFLPGHKPPKSPGRPPGANGIKARAARLANERLEEMLGRATEIISDELAITASTAAPTARNAAAQEPGETCVVAKVSSVIRWQVELSSTILGSPLLVPP